MMDQKQYRVYFPIIFLLSWLGLTIFIFIFGPYKYKITHSFVFYSYLLAVHIALLLGYLRGQRSYGRGFQIKIDYYRFVKISIIISFSYFILKLILTFGGDLRHFSETFKNASKTYLSSSVRHSNIFSYLDIIFTPISLIAITNAIFSYKNLGRRYRYSVFILILFSIASAIGSATRSGIVQTLIISMAAFSLGVYKKNIILKYYHKVLIFVFGATLVIGFLIYSSLLTNTRGGRIVNNPLTKEPPRKDFFLTRVTSPELHPLINNVSFYISHSYYRLNKAMNLPFKGLGFGLSNSYFIMDNIESLTGWSGLKNISYGVRLDKGIGSGYGLYWSTFYTWIASDFTFPGTIIVVFFIGYFFSLALKDTLFSQNPLSVTVFCSFFYFIFHFAFNNPLQDGAGLTTYLFVPVIWFIFRKKF
jgi:energy-converting hydrogenase Eha subunit E